MSADVVHLKRWRPTPDIATKLRAIRRGYAKMLGRKLPQTVFADMIGYGHKAYAAWESGANQPDDLVELATRLRDTIGVDPSYILDIDLDGPRDPSDQVKQSFPCMSATSSPRLKAVA